MKTSPHNPNATFRQSNIAKALDYQAHQCSSHPACRLARIDWLMDHRRWLQIPYRDFCEMITSGPLAFYRGGISVMLKEHCDGLCLAKFDKGDYTYWLSLMSPNEARRNLHLPFADTLPIIDRDTPILAPGEDEAHSRRWYRYLTHCDHCDVNLAEMKAARCEEPCPACVP